MATTTTLVHRLYSGPRDWWREGIVYEIDSPELDGAGLTAVQVLLDHVAGMGFHTVLVRPSRVDVSTDAGGGAAFRSFVERSHRIGLRTMVRISGALGPVTGPHAQEPNPVFTGLERPGEALVERAEAFLLAGADGIDMGTITPPGISPETDLEALSDSLLRILGLLAEHTDDGILGMDVTASHPEVMRHHLQDDWLHHLRDDSLALVRWDASSIRRHLTFSLAEHDRFGAAPVWRFLPSHRLVPGSDPGDGRRWFSVDACVRQSRARALELMALALPGTAYVREGDETGLTDAEKPVDAGELARLVVERAAQQGHEEHSPTANFRHAVRLRRELRLPSAPLAFVEGLDWCPASVLTFLSRSVLVLVNTGDTPVALPVGAEVLISSAVLHRDGDHRMVPPGVGAWIEAGSVS